MKPSLVKSIKGISGEELNEYMDQRESDIVSDAHCGMDAMRLVIGALFGLDAEHPKVILDVEKAHNKCMEPDIPPQCLFCALK